MNGSSNQTMALSRATSVVVLGGGPAGLCAAWELSRAGVPVVIVEKADATGGLCRTFRRRGFSFDQGGHRFITKDRDLFDRVTSLLGDRLRVAERRSVVRVGDREYSYPLELSEVIRGEGLLEVLRIVCSYVASRLRRRTKAGTFESWVQQNFGRKLYERFFREYTEKLWGVEASLLSSDWAGQRIPRLSLARAGLRALGLDRRPLRTFARKYCYPRRGIGEIFESVAEEVVRLGGTIVPDSRPLSITPGKPVRVEVSTPYGVDEVCCEYVLSTIPLPDLVELLPAKESEKAHARSLRFRALRFLNLLLEGPSVSDKTWVYVPARRYLMTRLQIPAQRSSENCPPGFTSLQLEIPCQPGDAVWLASHEELVARGLSDLRNLGISVEDRLLDSFDTRADHAYPVYERGYREHRDALLAWIDSLEGIDTRGRQGRFQYTFFDRAMREGIDAARGWMGLPVGQELNEEDPLLPEESRSVIESLPRGPVS